MVALSQSNLLSGMLNVIKKNAKESFPDKSNQRECTIKKPKNYHNRPFFNTTFATSNNCKGTPCYNYYACTLEIIAGF